MKFRTIQTTIFTVCLCACVTAFSGCSKGANEPYEMPSGDSSLESSGEYSDESSETSGSEISDDDISSESSSKPQTSSNWELYEEVRLDHEILGAVEDHVLYVWIHLYMDEEVLRAEFEEKNPRLVELENEILYTRYFYLYLYDYGEQISREFLSDYGITWDEVSVMCSSARISGYFDKSKAASMLDDLRVSGITYLPSGPPVFTDL
ncbi:MAG: hypothetical protein K2N56_10425 [Oscillospiraceae bacterium]|nr:hypothetical protein [Oscillospiraceae bacterium]